jgi:hypothetical protein
MELALGFFRFVLLVLGLAPCSGIVFHQDASFNLAGAIASANPGDTILVPDGLYLDQSLIITQNSITVKAANAGKAFLNGATAIKIQGNLVVFSGFQFTSGLTPLSRPIIEVAGNQVTISNCNFQGFGANEYVFLGPTAKYATVTHNNFESKPIKDASTCVFGMLLPGDWGCGPSVHVMVGTSPGFHSITYNSFLNMPGSGGSNGNEILRIGCMGCESYFSNTIVEYNLFMSTQLGDAVSIGVRSMANLIRFNTFSTLSTGFGISFIKGNMNAAYSNIFAASGGIDLKEVNDTAVFNNYFSGSAAPMKFEYVSTANKTIMNNIKVVHNTFVDSMTIDLAGAAVPATMTGNVIMANNIFIRPGTAATVPMFANAPYFFSGYGNIYSPSINLGLPPLFAGGFNAIDPALAVNGYGVYVPTSRNLQGVASPNWDFSSYVWLPAADTSLSSDITGQSRPQMKLSKAIGCSEYTPVSAIKSLTLTDVGPAYTIVHTPNCGSNVCTR